MTDNFDDTLRRLDLAFGIIVGLATAEAIAQAGWSPSEVAGLQPIETTAGTPLTEDIGLLALQLALGS